VSISAPDETFMRQAMALAERGRGHTHPNPVVGAVIVRGGRVLASGYHHRAGQPHAEIEALAQKGLRPRGATLYVTLEPCCHQGRTGPCTEAILAAGIRRVVVGCCDENPLVSGRGILRLRRAGVRVDVGCLKDECHAQNRSFFRWIRGKRPWVTLKVAATLDGFISAQTVPRDPRLRFVTGPQARAFSHHLRAQHNAILVGAGTVLADNPRLTVRASERSPFGLQRVVLDGNLRTPPSARIFRQFGTSPALVVGAQPGKGREAAAHQKRERALRRAGADVLLLPADRAGNIPIRLVLRALAKRGIQSLLVEGGSQVHAAFISARMVDSVAFFFAPRLVGSGRRIVEGPGLDWRAPLRLGPLTASTIGKDVLLQADVIHPSGTV
jgi:diaminohydroxyphosphoribosylaminopyrimidine deaminase / 5-amino-6-(5-phosphoribosylamino)uracil reductase